MNIFTRAWRWVTGNSTAQKKGTQDSTPSGPVHESAPNIGVDGALQISTVWACVNLLVEVISSLPMFIYTTNPQGYREKVPPTFRIFQILNRSPNAWQTAQEFWEQMLLNFFLRGNCYARIARDAKGEILSLWPMASDQIDVIQLEDGQVFYKYYKDHQPFIFAARDVFHIRGPGNGLIGMSQLDYMKSSLGLAVRTQDHISKTYSKGARQPGVLMSDVVLSPEQRTALKANFGDIVNGTDKELYILEAQFKFQQLGMTPADLQLLETRKFSIQDLARWFGVPSVLINDNAESTSLGSSIDAIIIAFFKLKLRPQLSRIEKNIDKNILSTSQRAKGYSVEFNFDALLRTTLKERMEIYAKGAQNGLTTRNEARRMENQPPLPGGDGLTVQSNLIPIEQLGVRPAGPDRRAVPPDPVEQ
jgi:HK97 family phage portal protein